MHYFAYLDPTTGSLFIQSAIGAFLAISVAFRKYIGAALRKIKLVFSRQAVVDGED